MAPHHSVFVAKRDVADGRFVRRSGGVHRSERAAAPRRAVLFAVAVVAVVVPRAAAAACVTPPRVHAAGTRARLSMSSGLDHVQESDFRLLFRMTGEDFWALHSAVEHRLVVDERMATLSSGAPIPTACRLALGLRMLAGASYLDCMLVFGVSRCTVYSIFHQV